MTMEPHDARDGELFHKGDRIRKARELAGYSDTTSFATAAGLDRGALRRYEQTGKVPRRATLIAIAWHTPVRLEWLETGQGPVFKGDGGDGATGWAPWGSNPRPADYKVGASTPNRITFAGFGQRQHEKAA